MKKTVKINLGGFAYNIDEDAYARLDAYMEELKAKLGASPDATETLGDIEERASELLSSRLNGGEVVTLGMVEEVIAQLGNPDEIAGVYTADTAESSSVADKPRRRLYRNPEGSIIAGVCSGMAEYFAVDPLVLRVLFLVLLLFRGAGFLIYLIFWIATPRALTPKQKLEMRGEPVTLENLGSTIKDEMNNVKRNIEKSDPKGVMEKLVAVLGKIAYGFLKFMLVFLKAIGIIIGTVLVATMLFAFVLLVNVLFFDGLGVGKMMPDVNGFSINEFITSMFEITTGSWVTVPLFLVLAIPVVALIYTGIRIIFRFKARDGVIGGIAGAVWIVAAIILATTVLMQARTMTIRDSQQISVNLEATHSPDRTIYLNANDSSGWNSISEGRIYNFLDYSLTVRSDERHITGRPNLVIIKTNNDEPSLTIIKDARGMSRPDARQNASEIIYSYSVSDSILTIAPRFQLPEDAKWKGQIVTLKLCLPEGYAVNIDKSLQDILEPEQPHSSLWPNEMVNKTWRMTSNGLRQVK